MAFHDTEVKQKLGEDVRSAILSSAEDGTISANIMQDIAYKLHRSIGGNHKIRVACGEPCDKTEMRHILGDWWEKELFQLTSREALQRLVAIFEDPDVDLRPLAMQLRNKIGDVEKMEIEVKDRGDLQAQKELMTKSLGGAKTLSYRRRQGNTQFMTSLQDESRANL